MTELTGHRCGLVIQLFIESSQHLRKPTKLGRVNDGLSHLCALPLSACSRMFNNGLVLPSPVVLIG
ncbi:MAG: hypothetical protein ACK55Z_03055, partial [bacterium]